MAINFPNSPSNGDTHTAGGKTFTYNSTVGAWVPAAGATTFIGLTDTPNSFGTASQIPAINSEGNALEFIALPSSVTVYATADLLPLSGNSAGDQALVTATNRLYIWNGSGWYNIALINTNPSISGVSSSYSLASDGTATVITITATDPEGLPITYSIASDTSGNIATVTQGTGANTNVFTITPSTSEANAGTFSLTFQASDGVNIATAPASFILSFANPIITTSQHGSDWNGNTITTVAYGGTGINVSGSYAYELTGMTDDFGAIKVLMPDIWTALDDDDGLIVVAFTNHSATFNNRGLVSIGISDSSDANQIIAGFASYATSTVYQTWLHPAATTTVGTVGGTLTVNSDPGVGDQANWDLAMRHRASTNNLKFWVRPKTGSYANQWVHIASHSGYTFTPANFRLYVNQRILTNPRPLATLLDATSFSSTLTF
jgi:hypothetical protein